MSDVAEAIAALLARIDKELVRQDSGTVAVGGIAKLGAALQALLKACFRESCALHQVMPQQVLDRAPRGSGDYLRGLSQLGLPSGGSGLLRTIIADARDRRGRLNRLTELRNTVAHEGRVPDSAGVKRLMLEVQGWLRPMVRPERK